MLDIIRQFFETHVAPGTTGVTVDSENALRLALAVLLVEVAESDYKQVPEEKAALLSVVREAFELSDHEAEVLISLAEQEHRDSTDYFQFTRLINRNYTAAEKIQLVESLWKIAYADHDLHRYEEHVIRRLSDLIHVPHNEFIAAKHRVEASIDNEANSSD